MNKEELTEKLEMVYLGDRDILNYLIGYYDGLKGVIELLKEENQELKKQLHDASIQIQEMIEQDIECPSNCSKLKELKKRLEVGEKQYNDVVEKMEKQREVIDKAIEYINEYAWKEDIIGDIYTVTGKPMVDKYMQLEWDNCKELLGILSEVE